MKKVLINAVLAAVVCLQIGCSETADNANQANIAAPTPTATPAEQTNANVAVAAATPLPTFTNADEALAAGKQLLDDLEADKAVESLQQAVKLNPDLADAHFNLGIAYALLEKVEENTAPSATEPTPTPTRKGKKEVVTLTASEKSFESAVKSYKKILAKNPKDDAAHFNLGRSLNKLNQDPEALKSLQQAVKLKPEDSEYQTELGAILIKLAQYQEAVAALKKAMQLDETNGQAESLLEKAEAGRRRIDFGNKPKPLTAAPPAPPRSKNSSKPSVTNSKPEAPPPPTKNANQ